MKLSDILFDRCCGICGCHVDNMAVCRECDAEIKAHIKVREKRIYYDTDWFNVIYLFDYDVPIVKRLLFSLKRSSNKDLFRYAAQLYRMAVPPDFHGTVTYCPRRAVGKRIYGHDQVEVPCKIMCKTEDGRLKFDRLLKRRGFSKEQKKLTQKQRIENTKSKFKAAKKDIRGDILICDDVITTGSTAGACAYELLHRGKNVNVTIAALASRNAFSGNT